MPKLSLISNLFFWLSLLFLIYYLLEGNYLDLRFDLTYSVLFLAFTFGLIGFYFESCAWHYSLQKNYPNLKAADSYISSSKFIFTKYIPGKVWVVLGRPSYLGKKYGWSFKELSASNFLLQILAIFVAFILGSVFLFPIHFFLGMFAVVFGLSSLIIWIKLLNTDWLKGLFEKADLQSLLNQQFKSVGLFLSLTWLSWAIAFFFLLSSVKDTGELPITVGFLFPLAAVFGVVAIFAPGGLGVREGLITLGLQWVGLSFDESISLAALSRLWFLGVELLFFLSGFILAIFFKK